MQLWHNKKIVHLGLILQLSSKILQQLTIMASGGVCVSTYKCAGIVGCSCYIFELNHSINYCIHEGKAVTSTIWH